MTYVLWAMLCLTYCLFRHEIVGGSVQSASVGQHLTYKSPFRYVIISNMVNSNIGDSSSSEDHRYIEVLLDVNAFSEGNLKILCAFVSKRFPAPNVLHMKVYTHLEDIETPEEQDRGVIFETSDDPSKDRYYRAFYLRDYYGNEWFSYNPNAPSRELKLVVLKGRGPYAQPK